jgi:hypothetical protein
METRRIVVFLLGCILSRTLLTVLAMKIDPVYLPYMGYIAFAVAVSFFYLYIFGNARADGQLEWLGDAKIWWNDLRPVHGGLFMLFAALAVKQSPNAWMVLALDTLVGLTAWLFHHKLI